METTKNMDITKDTINSMLFLKYLFEVGGFRPDNFDGILELGQAAPTSLSQFLTMYRQYLLSRKVVYSELGELGLYGAYGYVENGEIIVPKTLGNDLHFLHNGPRVKHSYNYPKISEFSAIICLGSLLNQGIWPYINNTASLRGHHKFFGLCMEYEEARNIDLDKLSKNICSDSSYHCMHDKDPKTERVYFLARK